MKLKKIFALCISAALMLTGCIQKNDDVELSEEEKEHNAVIGWFENNMFDDEEFTDLTDYQYYARTIGLEKDELLSPDMWEVYYSDSININKEIDGSAVYLIRLNPDKLLEVWAANNDMTAEEICTELGTNRDDLYYNFGYTANSIGYAKNHKDNKVSYPESEERIFGVDNGENRQAVFSTHFLKVHTGGKYRVTYESTDESLEIWQRDLLKSTTKSKTYDYSDYSVDEYTPAFTVNDVGIKRIQLLALPNGWVNAKDTAVTIMFNMSPFSYGCTDEDRIDIFTEETEESISETENVPVEHLETEAETQSETEISTDVPVEHIEETVTEGVTE